MRSYIAFCKKEVLENLRTHKVLILMIVFLLFGMMSPLTAKLMPEIFKSLALDGIVITIPEPTALDAYAQFFKNTSQMGLLVVLLVFGGMLSTEITKGTLINMVTKGLSRHVVILAKFTVASILWTLTLLASFITTFGYTAYLFGSGIQPNLLFSIFCLWLFGLFLLASLLFFSSFTSGNFAGLALTAVSLLILLLLDIFPRLHALNPIALASLNTALLSGASQISDLTLPVGVTLGLTVLLLGSSMMVFRRRKL
ncbi:MAG TPA: hypothetical protein DCQ90_01185 [Erysipelotrichaceae bacterium]|nr:hypothetical protein [Erysipelotrichaceae bacterium]